MEVKEDGGSFPSNYVTIHDLKQRWLQQQQDQEQIAKKSNHELNPKPTTPPRNHRHRSRKSPPPPHVHDDALATKPVSDQNPSQPVEKHQTRNQKPKHKTTPLPPPQNDDDAPPRHRSRNQKSKHKLSASPEKQQHQPQLPKHNTKTNNHHAARVEQPAQRSRNNKVVSHPKTPPFDAAAADEPVAASVNVCNMSHTKEGYGRFKGGSEQRTWPTSNRYPKPPSWGKKPQISQVWVKKGESAPN